MMCVEVRPMLDAYFDSELDLASSLNVEKHLSECAPCAETIRNLERLREESTPAVFNHALDDHIHEIGNSHRRCRHISGRPQRDRR